MKKALILAALFVSTVWVARAQDVVGDWQGTLKVGPAELRVVLHVAKGTDGSLKATLDSIDQGANGIVVDSIALKESTLTFAVAAVHGSYEGKVGASSIEGTWTQGQPIPLTFVRATTPLKTEHKPAKATDIDGTWSGSLDAGASKMGIVFHLMNTEDGLMGTMDVPDQNIKGVPITVVTRSGAALTLEMKQFGGKFEGKIAADLTTIDGTWTQQGHTAPLVLTRSKVAASLRGRNSGIVVGAL